MGAPCMNKYTEEQHFLLVSEMNFGKPPLTIKLQIMVKYIFFKKRKKKWRIIVRKTNVNQQYYIPLILVVVVLNGKQFKFVKMFFFLIYTCNLRM